MKGRREANDMFRKTIFCCVLLPVLFLCSELQAQNRPLDLILNSIQLDHHSPKLAKGNDKQATIEPDGSIGQTFRTGDKVKQIVRIAVWNAFWHKTWDPDEQIQMTLWDSPAKKVSYGRFIIPYQQRRWEQAVPMFLIQARVKPHTDYYFELTTRLQPMRPGELPREWLIKKQRPGVSGGDRKVGGFGIARADYPHGQAYVNGEPQDFDLYFSVHVRRDVSRDELYKRAFGRFDLGYPPLAKVEEAVEAKNWDLAITELVKHFESRDDCIDAERTTPKYDPTFDTDWADWRDGWHFISSPVAAQAISPNFTVDPVSDFDFFTWYEPLNLWVNFENNTVPPTWSTANAINNGLVNNSANASMGAESPNTW